MGKISISLSDEMQAIVDVEIATGNYPDLETFFHELIADRRRRWEALEQAIIEGEESGISPLSFDEIFDQVRERVRSRLG